MFFTDDRAQFFTPLTGKYREVVSQCLSLLYQRLYTDLRDYGYCLGRDQLLDIFQEAIARAPLLEGADEADAVKEASKEGRFKSQRELASFILNRLLESGWLEKQVDEATLQSTFGFSRVGRLFTQPFVETDSNRVRTRHRNTRNTRNSLAAFVDQGEVHDLLDACEYSERIISDFTDIIAELEERKRQLVKEVEARQLVQHASEEFFNFMEKRFQPDVAVRLSADSVEKYRDEIGDLVTKIRRKRKDWKAQVEFKLRELCPDQVVEGQSILWNLLDAIELRLRNASEVMLPALRKALHGFTQRADIIMRQLSYLASQKQSSVLELCKQLKELPAQEQLARLARGSEHMQSVSAGFIDPAQVRLQAPRNMKIYDNSAGPVSLDFDHEARKELYIQALLDTAFMVSDNALRDYIQTTLSRGAKVLSSDLPIDSANDLLAAAHAIEVASSSNLQQGPRFLVEPTGRRLETEYFHGIDEFSISFEPGHEVSLAEASESQTAEVSAQVQAPDRAGA